MWCGVVCGSSREVASHHEISHRLSLTHFESIRSRYPNTVSRSPTCYLSSAFFLLFPFFHCFPPLVHCSTLVFSHIL